MEEYRDFVNEASRLSERELRRYCARSDFFSRMCEDDEFWHDLYLTRFNDDALPRSTWRQLYLSTLDDLEDEVYGDYSYRPSSSRRRLAPLNYYDYDYIPSSRSSSFLSSPLAVGGAALVGSAIGSVLGNRYVQPVYTNTTTPYYYPSRTSSPSGVPRFVVTHR